MRGNMGQIILNRKDPNIVTICFVRIRRMKNKGIHSWNPKSRGKLHQITYSQIAKTDGGSMRVHVKELSTKDKMGQLVLNRFGHHPKTLGYSIRLCGHGKTATHVKTKMIADVFISMDSEGNDVVRSVKLNRYTSRFRWFLKEK